MIKEKPDIRKKIVSEEKPEKLSKLPESPESYELESYDKKESERTYLNFSTEKYPPQMI